MELHKIEFEAFLGAVQNHPRFNELSDVLHVISGYVEPFLQPWERDFQDYLNRLREGNFLVRIHTLFGDKRKFFIKPRLQRYICGVGDSSPCRYLHHLASYMFYFPHRILDVEEQQFLYKGEPIVYLGAPVLIFPPTWIKIAVWKDGIFLDQAGQHYIHKDSDYTFSSRLYIMLVKQLLNFKFHDFECSIEFRFRLMYPPQKAAPRPNFNLVFEEA